MKAVDDLELTKDTEISVWTTLVIFLREVTGLYNTEGLGLIHPLKSLLGHQVSDAREKSSHFLPPGSAP